jgi:Domain of unknown function (DUF4124)
MVNFIAKNLLIFLSVYACAVSAGIYRGVDADGNVFYTDQPSAGAVEYKPTTISVVDPLKANPKKETADKEPAEFKYTKFDIVSPVPNQVIRNESDISISLQIAPPLNVEEGHNVWLLMDNKPVVKNSQSMSLKIGRVDRGAHKFQAQVRDSDGKIIVRTRTTIAHVKYNSL